MKTLHEIPITPTNVQDSAIVKTGDWKTFYPVLTEENCIKCYICWKFCPDVAISARQDELPVFDLEHCKGCGICAYECPKDAITMVREGD